MSDWIQASTLRSSWIMRSLLPSLTCRYLRMNLGASGETPNFIPAGSEPTEDHLLSSASGGAGHITVVTVLDGSRVFGEIGDPSEISATGDRLVSRNYIVKGVVSDISDIDTSDACD